MRLCGHNITVNLKKYCFHQNKICFIKYVMFFKDIIIKTKKIKAIKDWLQFKSVCDIYIFLDFTNFY